MILKLFTHPKCPKCPPAKELTDQLKKEMVVEKYDTSTVDGLAEAAFYQVMATPTLILLDDKDKVVAEWRGNVPSKKELKSQITNSKSQTNSNN